MTLIEFLLAAALIASLVRVLGTHQLVNRSHRHVPTTRFRKDLETPDSRTPGETLVVMVHGTFCDARTQMMWRDHLEDEGYPVWFFEYRYLDSIVRNAGILDRDFQQRLNALGDRAPRRIVVVGYSQGGLLLRWLLSGGSKREWTERVVGVIQVASPNAGCEPADLVKLMWGSGLEPGSMALEQLRPESRLMQCLAPRPLATGLRYGVVYGIGQGRGVLGRFMVGRAEGNALSRILGRLYEWLFLAPRENDGLVSVESALALHRSCAGRDSLTPRQVENDHLGLLVDRKASLAILDLVQQMLLSS